MYRSEDHRTFAAPSENGMEAPGEQSASDVWARVKRRLRAELGEDIFASWFGRLELDSVIEGCAYLTVPTRFLKSSARHDKVSPAKSTRPSWRSGIRIDRYSRRCRMGFSIGIPSSRYTSSSNTFSCPCPLLFIGA